MVNDVSIEKLRDHFIICGYGQVGRTVVDQLNRLQIPFVLIETNEGLCRELLKEKVLSIQGDAKRHDVLQSAGIERARGVCIVIDNDADNLYITVTAKALNPKARIITRAGQSRYAQAMRNSGADEVIIPEYGVNQIGLKTLTDVTGRSAMFVLFFHAAFARDFLGHQETPDGFISVNGIAGFSNLFLGGELLATRPSIAAALYAVEHDLSVVLAAAVSVSFRFLAAFL